MLAKVQAYNVKGWSVLSAASTTYATLETEPTGAPATPTTSSKSETQIVVDWTNLAAGDTGGSTILSYHLEYDDGTTGTTWTSLVGYTPLLLSNQYTLTGVTAGTTYMFRVQAKNIHGWGPTSTELSVKASDAPDDMVALTVEDDFTTGSIKISWTPPHDGSDTIT